MMLILKLEEFIPFAQSVNYGQRWSMLVYELPRLLLVDCLLE